MTRKCPRCQKPMVILIKNDIEMDGCVQCKGIWFDKDELNKITGEVFSIEGLIFTGKSLGRNIPCPKCNIVMRYVTIENIVVDICSKCEGIWLDANELSAIGEVIQGMKRFGDTWNYEIQEEHAHGIFGYIRRMFKD